MAMKAPPVARSSILALCPASSTRFEPFKSSFLRYGVKGLKTPRLRIAHSDRLRPNCYGGGAFGSQMNFFRRFTRIIKSYVKSILYLFQSPEKILDQAVIDMNNDLIKMNQATAQVLASQKQLENRYKSAQQASEKWYGKAQLALGEGDHNLVREALKRRKSFADNASVLRVQLDHQKSVVDNLVSNTRLLESKILEAKGKKDVLKARAQSAKTSAKVSEILGDIDTTSALYAFNKMEEKVLAMESRAEAFNDLTNNDLMEQFQLLECYSIDDELEPLQKDISGSSKKGELPPGRTAVPTNTLFPFHEAEIEKNRLRAAIDYVPEM